MILDNLKEKIIKIIFVSQAIQVKSLECYISMYISCVSLQSLYNITLEFARFCKCNITKRF